MRVQRKFFKKIKYIFILSLLILTPIFSFVGSHLAHAQIQTAPLLFSDNFTNIDGTSLISHNNNWVDVDNGSIIQGNKLHPLHPTTIYVSNFNSVSDQCVSFDVLFPLQSGVYFMTRYNPDTGGRFLSYLNPADNTYGIYQDDGDENIIYLDNRSYTPPSPGIHNIKQCSVGVLTTVYIDGVAIGAGESDHNPTGAGGIVLFSDDVDNFRLDSISLPTTVITPTNSPIPTVTPTPEVQSKIKISILSPKNNSYVIHNKKTVIYAHILSKNKVLKVEFYVNNTSVCTDKRFIYSCNWKVPKAKGVMYTLKAKVYDKMGNITISKPVTVTSR